jgi:hypothetical protein
MLVMLHGSGGSPIPGETYEKPYIRVKPWGRGPVQGYDALSALDVIEVIDYMKRWYAVDADRVCLTGSSMGGWGAWTLASQVPDLFAGLCPFFGDAINQPLENLRNVPVLNQHGAKDWVIPIDCSRFAISALQQRGYFAAHIEFPEEGHGITKERPIDDWVLAQRRPAHAGEIVYSCQTPEMGRAYWLTVRRMTDPHAVATVRANLKGQGERPMLTLDLANIDVLELDANAMGIDRSKPLAVQVGQTYLEGNTPLGARLFVVRGDGNWSLRNVLPAQEAGPRPYTAGAAASLYTGEPLLIVYGTRGSQEANAALFEAAKKLATFNGTSRRPMVFGRVPVKADRDVTEEDLKHFNLVLLGGARDNSIAARVLDKLPLKINAANELLAGDREPISLGGAGLRLSCYNPLSPQRLVFLISTSETGEKARAWWSEPERLLTGSDGRLRIDQADLIVQSFGGGDCRRMQFTHGWAWRSVGGADRKFPQGVRTDLQFKQAVARVIRRTAGTDFAFEWEALEPEDKCDFARMTEADLAVASWPREILVAKLSGKDLLDIHKRWVVNSQMAVAPVLSPKDIDPGRTYSVAMPPDFCWKLSKRHKNLDDVQAGPHWRPAQLLAEIFGPDK